MNTEIENKAQRARNASLKLSYIDTKIKNIALKNIAEILKANSQLIYDANKKDVQIAAEKGLTKALIDRLTLNEKRINSMIEGVDQVIALKDPVGEIIEEFKRPNGLKIKKVRVPLGSIAIIYEARPNVTVDSAVLCLKSGNSVILKGGSDAIYSNSVIATLIAKAALLTGMPVGCVEFVQSTDRSSVTELLSMRKYIDCVIPRGGAGLIDFVVENSRIPVIETGVGNCHAYVESSADLKMAEEIVFNAKVQRPSVCNAIETLLVDENISGKFLPTMLKRLSNSGVEIRGDSATRKLFNTAKEAVEDDWYREYLDLILAVKVVKDIDEAIEHISKYGSRHSEAIITKDKNKAKRFTTEIDSAVLYVNASTRFTDGGEFGFGSEIGISTQKLHARGPMGLYELTTYKYIVEGSGQTRQ